jgi:hypothetical protein
MWKRSVHRSGLVLHNLASLGPPDRDARSCRDPIVSAAEDDWIADCRARVA